MSTTTIRIEDTLKSRIAAAADRTGKTAHAFILDAISQTVEQLEQDGEFDEVAEQRWNALLASGKTVAWEETKAYLSARSQGANPRRPVARSFKP
jgi:predicted transcriptional regulator